MQSESSLANSAKSLFFWSLAGDGTDVAANLFLPRREARVELSVPCCFDLSSICSIEQLDEKCEDSSCFVVLFVLPGDTFIGATLNIENCSLFFLRFFGKLNTYKGLLSLVEIGVRVAVHWKRGFSIVVATLQSNF